MEIVQIPFVKHLGIQQQDDRLWLHPDTVLQNHIGTLHAGAIYTLAETASGMALTRDFPELTDKVTALLRSSEIRYKSPAKTMLYATAQIDKTEAKTFLHRLKKRGRASINVHVTVKGEENDITVMEGVFGWFVALDADGGS